MNFETFMESIKNHIKECLPESYQDAQVTIREQQKLNNRYMGAYRDQAGRRSDPHD